MRRKNIKGTVYLICFSSPYKRVRHYLGWTEGAVSDRLAIHQSGQGARLLRAAVKAGITLTVVREWSGTRNLERKLKARKCSPALCPNCRTPEQARHGDHVKEPDKATVQKYYQRHLKRVALLGEKAPKGTQLALGFKF